MILDQINKPNDIHQVLLEDFPKLAKEIRHLLIKRVSENGGHLASNLGVVELTMALHNVLQFPEDKLIWDVGHQSYTHKILTGRKDDFETLRQEDGLSGFPKRAESDCDSFDTGHSSSSISAGLGYVRARDLRGESHHVVSVIGDGALTGGMAFEALNNAALLKTNFIIVLNDNNMSISRNVGGMSTYLSAIRTAESYTGVKLAVTKSLNRIPKIGPEMVDAVRTTKSSIKQLIIPGMLFENMGLTYLGPVDGHNMIQMMRLFNEAKKVQGPVLVHVLTRKGRGYVPAQERPDRFHGTGPFRIQTGELISEEKRKSYTDIFSDEMCALGEEYPELVAVTAAMPGGTGLKKFAVRYPSRFFDVGIAEAHAVTFSAGLALGGMIPVFAVYSSFLQRGFDQILHDVCMQNLHVIFAIDRAGFVGADGETHHGCFDLSYLTMMPNMTVMAPADGQELREMLRLAAAMDGPVAIRYPKECAPESRQEKDPVVFGKSAVCKRGEKIAVLSVGSMTQESRHVIDRLEKEGVHATLVNIRFVKPMDHALFDSLSIDHKEFITIEENVRYGGFGEHLSAYMQDHHPDVHVTVLAAGDRFVSQGKIGSQRQRAGISQDDLYETIKDIMKENGEI